ncbi:acyl-CoA dehydrogenase family protein [Pseudomonas sp. S5F11]|nr:acyl-CoA dehydrogenase family protein [Pseudomonas sp. S5F11]
MALAGPKKCKPMTFLGRVVSAIGGLVEEIVNSASMAFGMFGGLTLGAYRAVRAHGSESLKKTYLSKLAASSWTGTVCMTEPQAGTDLSLIRTRGQQEQDGVYRINGAKIFISGGEHDLVENIVHLVLAKLPGAPLGSKGISLFLVPKYLPNPDGSPGSRNGVSCGSIEHKMGLRGSPTCVLNFDNATGWLMGEPNGGLAAMFTMMNSARLEVALQALGVAHASYEKAAAYKRGDLRVATSLCLQGGIFFLAQIPVCKTLITFKKISDLYHLYEYLSVLTAAGDSRADFSFCTLIFLRGFKHVRAMPKLQLGKSRH